MIRPPHATGTSSFLIYAFIIHLKCMNVKRFLYLPCRDRRVFFQINARLANAIGCVYNTFIGSTALREISMEDKHTKTKSMIMMIASLLIVGTIGLFRRFIPLSSPMLAFSRGLIGGTSLLIFLLVRGRKRLALPRGKTLLALIVNGAFLGVNCILLFEAFNHTTIAKATLCYSLQPTIVLLLSPHDANAATVINRAITSAAIFKAFIFQFLKRVKHGVVLEGR